MNAARLADAAGLSRSVISLAERGKRTLREDTILRLAAALDVPPAVLLGGGASWQAGYDAGYETGLADGARREGGKPAAMS